MPPGFGFITYKPAGRQGLRPSPALPRQRQLPIFPMERAGQGLFPIFPMEQADRGFLPIFPMEHADRGFLPIFPPEQAGQGLQERGGAGAPPAQGAQRGRAPHGPESLRDKRVTGMTEGIPSAEWQRGPFASGAGHEGTP